MNVPKYNRQSGPAEGCAALRTATLRTATLRTAARLALLAIAASYGIGLLFGQGPISVPSVVESKELHNVWRLSNRVLSGSEPETPAAFAELARLGVKTIVSVDGLTPQLDLAKKNRLRYVHIPIGYDGIPKAAALSLARVARDTNNILYVHCHHGKHRGPAAAAIVCRVDDGRSILSAMAILEKAGTGKEYPGLWRDVKEFVVPGPLVELPDLVDSAQIESLAATMAKIDRSFDRLKQIAANGWRPSVEHANPLPSHQCIQLHEQFVEAARVCDNHELRKLMESNAASLRELSEKIKLVESTAQTADEGKQRAASDLLAQIGQRCTQCHKLHRN